MESNKSFEVLEIFVALAHDVLKCADISPRAIRLTETKIRNRVAREGMSFLTKALPRLGKALDRALLGDVLNCEGFRKDSDTQLPKFFGELFQRVLAPDGRVLPVPCKRSIASLRDVLYCFYKYELPYSKEQEQKVLVTFSKTDVDLELYNRPCTIGCDRGLFKPPGVPDSQRRARLCGCDLGFCHKKHSKFDQQRTTYNAQQLLERLFQSFDWRDIYPRHGPGAVSTREQGLLKYVWSGVSERLIDKYPLDAYFYASLLAVADEYREMGNLAFREDLAQVILVPKDSRGPRLISEEPLAFQWIQQGVRAELYRLVEENPLTRYSIHFTDQSPNQRGALLGSQRIHRYGNDAGQTKESLLRTGKYATLDLKEASDRVSLGLVKLLFPEHIVDVLMACRSLGTRLPNGQEIMLNKYAPMGSALCFPVLALSIWAILSGGGLDGDHIGEILVYGDDVIVPTAQAEYAIELLESYGLLVNRDKSCFQGFFRESCGVDAYDGTQVTPVRFRKVWSSARCPDTLTAWTAYENTLFKKGYMEASSLVAMQLQRIYGGVIPHVSEGLSACAVASYTDSNILRRFNSATQRWERRIWALVPKKEQQTIGVWPWLLKKFSEQGRPRPSMVDATGVLRSSDRYCSLRHYALICAPLPKPQVDTYTKRRTNRLCKRWVPEREPFTYDVDSRWWFATKKGQPLSRSAELEEALLEVTRSATIIL